MTKNLIKYIGIVACLYSCSTNDNNLIHVEHEKKTDVTNIDSIENSLNGYWLLEFPENTTIDKNTEHLLYLNFESHKSIWHRFSYEKTFSNTSISTTSCNTISKLIKVDNQIKIEHIGFLFQDTIDIDYLSNSKFVIENITYLKHKGYP